MNQIKIFDTTLRDGEQSPGASMSISQKLIIAHHLSDMGVDVIEAGFPISSTEQYKATQLISKEIKNSSIAALARAVDKDIDCAYDAIKNAKIPRIHIFLASSPVHRKYKLKKSKSEILEMTKHSVSYAKNKCNDIEFSPEDATRTELDFLVSVVETAIDAGATTINIPDTVGYITPNEYTHIITHLFNNVSNIDKAIISAHCHDDLGLAVANSLAAVLAGVQQIEVTINGIGERAGNAALEEVVMGLSVRSKIWNAKTNITLKHLHTIAKLVSNTIGFPIPRNKAIVGENAFAHESGIHQDGVLKHRNTYEIMTPQMVGLNKNSIVLGRHSGIHGLKNRLEALHITLSEKSFKALFKRFSEIADKKKEVYDEDLYALIHNLDNDGKNLYKLISMQTSITFDTNEVQKAHVVIQTPDGKKSSSKTGNGPVDAIFQSIAHACGFKVTLNEYHIDAVTPYTDALGEATVHVTIKNRNYIGRASSTDVIKASANAYISSINSHVLFLATVLNKRNLNNKNKEHQNEKK